MIMREEWNYIVTGLKRLHMITETGVSGEWMHLSACVGCTRWTACEVSTGACQPHTLASLRPLSILSSTRASNVNCWSPRPTPAWTKRKSLSKMPPTLWAWCSQQPPPRPVLRPSPTLMVTFCLTDLRVFFVCLFFPKDKADDIPYFSYCQQISQKDQNLFLSILSNFHSPSVALSPKPTGFHCRRK